MLVPPRCTVALPKNSRPACDRMGGPSRRTTHGPNRGARGEADDDGELGRVGTDAVATAVENERVDDDDNDDDDEWAGVGGGERDSDRGMAWCSGAPTPASEFSERFLLASPTVALLFNADAEEAATSAAVAGPL